MKKMLIIDNADLKKFALLASPRQRGTIDGTGIREGSYCWYGLEIIGCIRDDELSC